MVRVIVYAIAGSVGGGLVGILVSFLTKGAFAPFIMLSFIVFGLLSGVLAILVNVRDRKKFVGGGDERVVSPALTTAPLSPLVPFVPLPKWVVAVFKVYGLLNFAIVLVSFVALISSVAVVGGIPPFRVIVLFIVMAAYSLTVGFGSWYLKRWVVPLFGFVFLTNFASLFIGGVSIVLFQAVPAVVISVFIFGIGYKYRDGLSGRMVSLLPQLLFVITGILILVLPRVFPVISLSGKSDSVSGASDFVIPSEETGRSVGVKAEDGDPEPSYVETRKDLRLKISMRQLLVVAEIHRSVLRQSWYEGFDFSSADVAKLAEDIKQWGGELVIIPNAPATYYVAYSQLPDNPALFYCVDSTLTSPKIIKSSPLFTATSCP